MVRAITNGKYSAEDPEWKEMLNLMKGWSAYWPDGFWATPPADVYRLWAEGKTDVAIRLEQGCNALAKKHEVDLLCAYPSGVFHGQEDEHVFQSMCAEHSAVYSQ